MNRTDEPKKQPVPFGINGQREAIIPDTPSGDNSASYEKGFPPITMVLKAAGGLPPKGQDMNQILYELSNLLRWFSAGALNTFDADFNEGIGGYPKGAVILGNDAETIFINRLNGNKSNPNTTPTNWFNLSTGYLRTASNLSEIATAGPAAVAAAVANLDLSDTVSSAANALKKSANLSDLNSSSTARINLGLGDSATRSVGITTGTVAAGNDSRIVNAISKLDENISLPGNLTAKGTATAFKLVADDGSKTGIIYADGDVEGLRWGTSGSTGRLYTYISGIKTAADNSFQRKGDLGTADLNVIGTPAQCGTWFQRLSGSATSLRNYPANEAGTLLVLQSVYGAQQEYTTHFTSRKFIRGLTSEFSVSGPWGPWVEVLTKPATGWTSGTFTNGGWYRDPLGNMTQWAYLPLMSAGDNIVSFGVPFPNSVDAIFIQPVGDKATVPESNNTIAGNSLSGFTMASGYSGTRPFYYRAFGK